MATEAHTLSSESSGAGEETGLMDSAPDGARLRGNPTVAFDKSLDNILKLGTHDLTLEDDSLLVLDRSVKKAKDKKKRSCGFGSPLPEPSATQKIPLYNILWVALSDDGTALTIDFAEAAGSKGRLRAAQLSIAVTADADLPAGSLEGWVEAVLSRSYGRASPRRRAYVLVNPRAGPGGADRKWETQVRPLFTAARMDLTVVTTEYSGQAIELCERLDVDAYDIVVPCSGDGLPHEVFNGFGRRPDARRALSSIAVCHIPCGSGNAMSCNLYGTHVPSAAALAIVKGVATPMDLVSVTHGDRRTLSFLSQSLGIVAESDLATEHLRWMGEARFTWGFLQRFLAKKVYPCDLAVKVEIEHKDAVRSHYSRVQGGGGGGDGGDGNGGTTTTTTTTTTATTNTTGSTPTEDALATAGNGNESVAGTSESPSATAGDDDGLPPLRYGTVNDKLPEGWELIPHDHMGNFYCGNMAYMAPDANFFSAALVNDGYMDLVTVRGDISPSKSLQLLLSVPGGQFFENPLVNYRKISGYRIIPKHQKDGYISIDGERIPWEPFQAEIHRGLGLVLTKSGGYEAPGPKGWDKVSVAERFMA